MKTSYYYTWVMCSFHNVFAHFLFYSISKIFLRAIRLTSIILIIIININDNCFNWHAMLQPLIGLIEHCSTCYNEVCELHGSDCSHTKHLIKHLLRCRQSYCDICIDLREMIFQHAANCERPICPVFSCNAIRWTSTNSKQLQFAIEFHSNNGEFICCFGVVEWFIAILGSCCPVPTRCQCSIIWKRSTREIRKRPLRRNLLINAADATCQRCETTSASR